MNKIRIVIVDDDLAARNSIKLHLQDHPLYEVAADFQDGRAALRWLRENDVEILLCDMQMPAMDGLELLQMIRISLPDIAVIAISSFDDFRYTRGCMVAGVADYLLKHDLTRQRLLEVLDAVRERYRIQPVGRALKNLAGYCFESPDHFTTETIGAMVDRGEIAFDKSGLAPWSSAPTTAAPPAFTGRRSAGTSARRCATSSPRSWAPNTAMSTASPNSSTSC